MSVENTFYNARLTAIWVNIPVTFPLLSDIAGAPGMKRGNACKIGTIIAFSLNSVKSLLTQKRYGSHETQ